MRWVPSISGLTKSHGIPRKAAGFLEILQSATLHATQVTSLNDVRERKYGTDLYRDAVKAFLAEKADDPVAVNFANAVLEFVKEEPGLADVRNNQFLRHLLQSSASVIATAPAPAISVKAPLAAPSEKQPQKCPTGSRRPHQH
jgi:hypothetical protein